MKLVHITGASAEDDDLVLANEIEDVKRVDFTPEPDDDGIVRLFRRS